jgi:hypothetical protein
MPAVKENGNVMIPVQKDEGFLVNDNEKGINELAYIDRAGKKRQVVTGVQDDDAECKLTETWKQ